MAFFSTVSSSAGTASGAGAVSAASSLFGPASPDAVFSSGQSASVTAEEQSARAIIAAQRRDINRIRGYKLSLTPTDKLRLVELQEQIQNIESKSVQGTAREDELEDRRDLLKEADRIIGKPIVDVEVDTKLAEYDALRLALLAPKQDSATAKRVAFYERVREALKQEIAENPERKSLIPKFQSAVRQVQRLKPLLPPSKLSVAAREAYDDVVELINDHAGVKIELTVKESERVAALEDSIARLQGSLGPDFSQQPTPQDVSRAYTRLARA